MNFFRKIFGGRSSDEHIDSDVELVVANVKRNVEIVNESLHLANDSNNPETKLYRLELAKEKLEHLKQLSAENSFLSLTSLKEVEASIQSLEYEFLSSGLTDIYVEPETRNTQPGKWMTPGRVVRIADFDISGGFIYVGGKLPELNGYRREPALVDPALSVNFRSPDYGGDQMGYWPEYGRISPESRAAYIEWLASNRSEPETYIGYVFLYFYGIERRLLIDAQTGQVSEEEIQSTVRELYRLKEVYGENRSFNGYLTGLLAHVWVLYNRNIEPSQSLLFARRHTAVFKYVLAQTIVEGDPVTPKLALAWVKGHPDYNLRTPARRCEKEFNQLFQIRYQQKFGKGLEINPNKTRLRLDYYPASSSLTGYQGVKLDLPDVSRLIAPAKKLMQIANSCTDELNSFSRYVGRPGNSKDTLEGIALLPKELVTSTSYPQFERLAAWMNAQMVESDGLVSVQSMFDNFGEEAPQKINKKGAEILTYLAEKAGFGIAPDIRFHNAKPEIDGKLVLFVGGHGDEFSPSRAFNQVGTILRLGAIVAGIDNHIDDAEVGVLENLIKDDDQLSEIERRSLGAYLHWRLNAPAGTTGLKARLNSIGTREKSAVSHILISVAMADGKIDPSEIRQLENLYGLLGLEKSMVASDIHHYSTGNKVRLSAGKVARKDSLSEGVKSGPAMLSGFTLNRDLLKIHEEETRDAQSILETIFVDETILEVPEEQRSFTATSSGSAFEGLDEKHLALYEKLITKEKWSFDDVQAYCKELPLMMDGAIEVINDWAFDAVDAPLIENSNFIFIDLELVEEISTL